MSRLQAERLGGTAAVRPRESECPAHERHRPGTVERLRLRPGAYAPGDDALRNRRYPPAARRRSEILESVLKDPRFEILLQLDSRIRGWPGDAGGRSGTVDHH